VHQVGDQTKVKMILVDASRPGRLVSGCEASDKNYFGVGKHVDTIMSKLIL